MNLPIQSLPPDFEGCPATGLYRCPDATYRRIRAVSASRLKLCRTSYAAFYRNEPVEDTDSMRYGRAIDCYALEGEDAFNRRYVVAPSVKLTSADAKAEYAAWANDLLGDSVLAPSMGAVELRESFVRAIQARGGDVVEADWIEKIRAMREAIRKNANAEHHLTGPGEPHVVMVWRDPKTGLPMKGQTDRIQERAKGGVFIPDAKSVESIGYATKWSDTVRYFDLERTAKRLQWAISGAVYEWGWRCIAETLGLPTDAYSTFIVVERQPKPRCLWVALSEESMAAAHNQVREWVDGVAECVRTGVWPDGTDELVVLEV